MDLKKHSSELTATGIVIVTAAAILVAKHLFHSRNAELHINKDTMEWMRQNDGGLTYVVNGHVYSISYIGTTPNF